MVMKVSGYSQPLIFLGFNQLMSEELNLCLGLFPLGDIDTNAKDFSDLSGFIPNGLVGPGNPGS